MKTFEEINQRNKEFDIWRLDLEARLAHHMFFDEEGDQRPDVQIELAPMDALLVLNPRKRVEVTEDSQHSGIWIVYFNGLEVASFMGPLAQYRATKKAGELLNDEDLPKGE